MISYFDPQPTDVPARMPSPFAVPPHPLALRAIRELEVGTLSEGKMFGVLVVRDAAGRIGYLRAFSGMLDGSWDRDGFVGPAFDAGARAAFWPAGEAELGVLATEQRVLDDDPAHVEHAVLVARHAGELAALKARHAERKAERKLARAGGGSHALDQQSRADSAERRELDRAHAAELAPLDACVAELTARAKQLARRRAERSRELLVQIQDTYAFASARGEVKTLRELFAPDSPPGGAGDCAAPKLLAYAYRHALQPLALAEVWLGPPPSAGDRRTGACYPACRGKCGPILAHVLAGLDAEPPPVFGDATQIPADEPRVVFEDRWLVVVAKPVGLLSVPGRSGLLTDSVQTRLAARYGAAHVVHRLDLDVSGLMLVAKDEATHAILQKMFARREIHKRYVAILEDVPRDDAGSIELALRVDLDDRPRQLVDPVHGKQAITTWQVLDRASRRVALSPLTGRTHQLRVHCAVALSPIVGDRLYGTPGPRLLLHAEHLAFAHPHSGERLALELAAPF
ncbi:MAG TPA: RluA family pseudouridine synthase [Kofleriaceae bacterium]|nr:RluA family pseudouridine synthase [Kofleriaceae bacterium]